MEALWKMLFPLVALVSIDSRVFHPLRRYRLGNERNVSHVTASVWFLQAILNVLG